MLCPINESVIKSGFDGVAKEIGSIKSIREF
jgi:hypothetical protein